MENIDVPAALATLVQEAVGTSPTTRRGRQTYEAILSVAHAEFVEHDYHAVSIIEIARRSRASVGSLYRYFSSKEGLFLVVMANCLAEMYTAASQVWAMPWGYLARLEAGMSGYLHAFIRNRQVLGSAAHLGITSPRVRQMSWAMRGYTYAGMLRRLRADQEHSDVTPLESEVLMNSLRAMVDGYAHRAFIDGEFGPEATSDENVERAAKVLAGVWYRAVFGSSAPPDGASSTA